MRSHISTVVCFGVVAVCCLASGGAFAADSFRVSPSARSTLGMETGYTWLYGDILIPAGGRPDSGVFVNLGRDLGLEQAETTSVVFQACVLEKHFFNFEFLAFSPTGLTTVGRPFRLQNKSYSRGALVESNIDFNWIRFEYGRALQDSLGLTFCPRVGVHYLNYAITLNGETDEAGAISNTRRLDGTFPVLGIETRYPLPYGMEICAEIEGTHLISRGFLALARLSATWEFYPDIVLTVGCSGRAAQLIEDHQQLNNQWYFGAANASLGLSFTF
jgi:hypothetical protein